MKDLLSYYYHHGWAKREACFNMNRIYSRVCVYSWAISPGVSEQWKAHAMRDQKFKHEFKFWFSHLLSNLFLKL